MSYDLLVLVLLVLIFCFFSMMLTVNVIFRMFNAVRPEGTDEIKPLKMRKTKKSKEQLALEKKAAEEKRRYDILMSNLDAYDGTDIGQREVK